MLNVLNIGNCAGMKTIRLMRGIGQHEIIYASNGETKQIVRRRAGSIESGDCHNGEKPFTLRAEAKLKCKPGRSNAIEKPSEIKA